MTRLSQSSHLSFSLSLSLSLSVCVCVCLSVRLSVSSSLLGANGAGLVLSATDVGAPLRDAKGEGRVEADGRECHRGECRPALVCQQRRHDDDLEGGGYDVQHLPKPTGTRMCPLRRDRSGLERRETVIRLGGL